MNKYSISYLFKATNTILEKLEIEAEDMVRACVLAEKRIEIDTRNSYEIISIKKKLKISRARYKKG